MLPVQPRAYTIFNFALVAANALIVVVYLVLAYTKLLGGGQFLGTTPLTTIIGIVHIVYALLVFPFLKRKSIIGASLIGTSLFSFNLIVLLLATGGFNSPYYALWLLLVLAIGIYKPAVPLGFLAAATIYFGGQALANEFQSEFFANSILSLIATYITGGLGYWLWHTQHTKYREGDPVAAVSEKLTQEQLKSEILVRSIGDGVVVVGPDGKIQLLNPAAEKLTGWSEAEAKGIDHKVVLPLSDESGKPLTDDAEPFFAASAKKDSVTRNDIVLLNRQKQKLALSFMASPVFGEGGKVTGGVGVFRDITKQKDTERQRDEFISTASHEMRTPVAAVDGYISLALNPKVAQIDDKASMYLKKAQDSSRHLGRLFQDLLSTTKLEDGKLPNHPEVFDLSSLVKVVIDEVKFKAEKKQLSVALVTNPEMHGGKNIQPLYYVNADPERIREVLTNLIDNAIKFSNKGEISVTITGDNNTVSVGVHDQGIGIAPDDLPHLFQKFYRIDNSRTRTIGGTGLGLYLCRAMVELAGGRMWAESKPEAGSHFYFSLPRISTAKAQELRSHLGSQAAHSIKHSAVIPSGTQAPVAATVSGKVE